MESFHPIQTAIFNKLKADATFMNLMGNRLYDYIPQSSDCPYAVLKEMNGLPDNTFGKSGEEVYCTIYVYSQDEGNGEAQTICGVIKSLLDYQPLTIEGYTLVYIAYDAGNISTGIEGTNVYRDAFIKFRILVRKD